MIPCMLCFCLSLPSPQTVVKTERRAGVPSAPVHNPIQTPDFGMIVDDEISVVPEWQVSDVVSNPAHGVLSVNSCSCLFSIQSNTFVPEG